MSTLVTGITSRTASPRAMHRYAFGAMLSAAIPGSTRKIARVDEDVQPWNFVIAGLGSPLAPSSNYVFGGLLTAKRAHDAGRLKALFIDESDVDKIGHGIKAAAKDPYRLMNSFFRKRDGYDAVANDAALRDEVFEALQWIASGELPPILWPSHTWGSGEVVRKNFPNARDHVGIDPTPVLLEVLDREIGINEGPLLSRQWLHEMTYLPFIGLSSLGLPVVEHRGGNPADFRGYWGVLQGAHTLQGWWTPTPARALRAGTLFATNEMDAVYFGSRTVGEIEDMTVEERTQALQDQRIALEASSWSMEDVRTALTSL
jgi:hypothetical protein